jgi:threonine/homoserine/homoserine lactone efflux protein
VARFHRRRDVNDAAALGVASADGVYATVAVVGGRAVADAVAPISAPLRVVAAVVLAAVAVGIALGAVRTARRPPGDLESPAGLRGSLSPGRAYAGLLALTLANPATVVYFVALVAGNHAAATSSALTGAVFASCVLLASASWQLLLVGGGHALGALASSPRGRLVVSLVASGLVLALAVRTAVG